MCSRSNGPPFDIRSPLRSLPSNLREVANIRRARDTPRPTAAQYSTGRPVTPAVAVVPCIYVTAFVTIGPAGPCGKTQESAGSNRVRAEQGERRNAFTARHLVVPVGVVRNAEVGDSRLPPSTTNPQHNPAIPIKGPPEACPRLSAGDGQETRIARPPGVISAADSSVGGQLVRVPYVDLAALTGVRTRPAHEPRPGCGECVTGPAAQHAQHHAERRLAIRR